MPDAISRVYLADSLGSIGGGVLFSFVLIRISTTSRCFVSRRLESPARRRAGLAFSPAPAAGSVIIIAAGLTAHLVLINADEVTTSVQHWGRRVVFRASSPYGRLVVTDDAGQLTFFENGLPVISTQNVDQVEETVHYAMSQRPTRGSPADRGRIAGTRGKSCGTASRRSPTLNSTADPRRRAPVLRTTWPIRVSKLSLPMPALPPADRERYDVVIVDTPDPTTSQLNRFYTAEFYSESGAS